MGRRSIWSKQEVIDLSEQFVAATDEVWRLQNGDDPECKHFQKFADVGHYRAHKSTRQGIYVCTPSGVLLGSMNTHNTDAVLNMMKESLTKYAAMEKQERLLPADADIKPKSRPEFRFPENGLDLSMFVRDLPASGEPDGERDAAWNQDRIWFSQAEARKFLPEDVGSLAVGDDYSLPQMIVDRFARFALIDTARGQTTHYQPEEVADSRVQGTITAINGSTIQISFVGSTSASSPKSRGREYPHGIGTKLLGKASYDLEKNRFVEFEWVAIGSRWGRTVFNGRSRKLQESPIGFVIRLAAEDAQRIAPAFLFAYGANW